ncbi:TetR/AcrR family transcriptional regulator [Salibacterium aidingense]|uniref:TetR/AcrR family transcriptional regulator n=1 Tax=Salibacterium aidingense TaxID=384933 RepID=UPI00041C62A8|nr:TetR/AcrR family transcriptional regulator [Salibacterium aidingense]
MKKTRTETNQTIQRVIEISRQQFTEKGYANVALEEIVNEAQLTRGVIYHHFSNKKGLFLAVFEEVQKDIGKQIEIEAMKSDDLWEQLLNGCRAFLVSASETQNQRILLIDGPAVLGWDTFRKMDQEYAMNSLKEHLQLLLEEGIISPVSSIDALTHCLSGAMNEAALWIAESSNRPKTIQESMDTLQTLLNGYRM